MGRASLISFSARGPRDGAGFSAGFAGSSAMAAEAMKRAKSAKASRFMQSANGGGRGVIPCAVAHWGCWVAGFSVNCTSRPLTHRATQQLSNPHATAYGITARAWQCDRGMTTVQDDVRSVAVSRRARAMPASPIRKLAPLAELAKARGTKVYHLNIGQPDIETPACMLDRLKQIEDRVIEYSPSTGTPAYLESLRQYYARRLGVSVETRQILATTGGSESILFAFLACAN